MPFCQVLNPLFGYTKGSVVEAALQVSKIQNFGSLLFQVTGRNIWIFALIDSEPRMQTKPVVFYLFMTYSIIEIFRFRLNREGVEL